MDQDGNGFVDKSEMERFLASKNISEKYRDEIIEKLFGEADVNHDGKIQLNEFVELYWQTKNQLVQKQEELRLVIQDLYNTRNHLDLTIERERKAYKGRNFDA